jgi:hypothetical protein
VCGRVMLSGGQNAHSLAHFVVDVGVNSREHHLALTAQIDNNIGVVRIIDPFIIALIESDAQ